jgi:hypothetical protein
VPFDPAVIDQLTRAGGWTLFVALVTLIGVGLLRKWWVPGWLYVALEAKLDKLIVTVENLTDAAFPRRGGPGAR